MERTPEPELMDATEQAAAYAAADWSESHGKIPRYFRDRFPDFVAGRVIDLGCGPADVTVRFVKAFPQVTAVGIDGSEAMLEFGRQRIKEEGLNLRIRFEKRYLPDPDLEQRTFDAAICNSLLHHIADPVALWRTAALCVKPHAPVLMIDLVRPADHDAVVRLVNEHANDAPPVLRRDFMASLHAAYTIDEIRKQLDSAGLSDFKIDQTDEFHFVGWGNAPAQRRG
jgi:ubiquinone/menaquinone biosynthesis C-methylase UbiE